MPLIISLLLITGGILVSMLETAVITLEDAEKVKSRLIDKIEFFKKKPENFAFTISVAKALFFVPAFIFLGVWTKGETASLFSCLFGVGYFRFIFFMCCEIYLKESLKL